MPADAVFKATPSLIQLPVPVSGCRHFFAAKLCEDQASWLVREPVEGVGREPGKGWAKVAGILPVGHRAWPE